MNVVNSVATAVLVGLVIVLGAAPVATAAGPQPTVISIDQLKAALDDKGLVIVDTRLPKDWDKGETKIKGAVRGVPKDVQGWAKKYKKDQRLVVYCA